MIPFKLMERNLRWLSVQFSADQKIILKWKMLKCLIFFTFIVHEFVFCTLNNLGYKTRSSEGGYPPDIRPSKESSGRIFRDVRTELVLVSPFIGRKGTHTADWAVRALSLAGSILTSRKIHPEDSSGGRISGGYPPSGEQVLYPGNFRTISFFGFQLWLMTAWGTAFYDCNPSAAAVRRRHDAQECRK